MRKSTAKSQLRFYYYWFIQYRRCRIWYGRYFPKLDAAGNDFLVVKGRMDAIAL